MSSPALFQPIQVGDTKLGHRVVLAPLTRMRGLEDHTPGPTAAKYYEQRGSTPGTLLIAEATYIAPQAVGAWPNGPGIWAVSHVTEWKKVTDAVHAKGSKIFLQLFACGRIADPTLLKKDDPSLRLIGPSAIPLSEEGRQTPEPLTEAEISAYIQLFVKAAENSMTAGFDGVELHGANGYLLDQFLQSNANQRTDKYGGSVENRARLLLEVVAAVSKAIGVKKVGVRLGPWTTFQEMRFPKDEDVIAQFSYVVENLAATHSDLAFIHIIEPRVSGNADKDVLEGESNEFLRKIWAPRPFISAGGFTRESALASAEQYPNELIAFGRKFIANPDLPLRLKNNQKLTEENRDTFYLMGDHTGLGYTDYPFANPVSVAA